MIVDVHESAEPEREYGTPPILIAAHHDCPDCGRSHEMEECPDCGSRDVTHGYGLGFGPGIGIYKFCTCGWMWKRTDPDE